MRASTFFALFVAIVIFFAAVFAAKTLGLFKPNEPAPVAKVEYPKVLVASHNLNAGFAMTVIDVLVKELKDENEQIAYRANAAKYLLPTPEAASLRVLKRDVNAGEILFYDYLEPIVMPPGISQQLTLLSPGMKAAHVLVGKDRASGGLIRVGEHVDVYLTCKITGNGNEPFIKIAPLAQGLKVLLKQDIPYPVLLPVPEGKPMKFTLVANPYRAALIDFANNRGLITLIPTDIPPDAKPEGKKSFNDPNSKEYRNEDARIEAMNRGDRSIGDADLERIFNLPPLPHKENLQVVMMKGNKLMDQSKGVGQFSRNVDLKELAPIDPDQPNFGYQFQPPTPPEWEQPPAGPNRPAIAAPQRQVIQTPLKK